MTWSDALGQEKEKDYFKEVLAFVQSQKDQGRQIFPPTEQIFNAFDSASFEDARVVILGQDPYHGPDQAHGLCFSVKEGVRIPPSLKNIFKEIESDLGFTPPNHGNLQAWADQGVLLLNSVLTVEAGKAASHAGKGWEAFTDRVIEVVNIEKERVVFMLWGAYAQKKGIHIDREKHLVLEAPHPSPLSAHRGFLGCKHFSKTNEWLQVHNLEPIDWSL